MKKLVNATADIVRESLQGFVAAHSDLVRLGHKHNCVYRRVQKLQPKVAVISGGGSGHEPLHAGFVGYGMLDAAVAGPIFTSPTPDGILEAIEQCDTGSGVLALVKNYTGDVLNFETAAEMADLEGYRVKIVLINDDVSVEDSAYTAGRRGVAGAMLVEKIVGAAAESPEYDLDRLVVLGNKVVANTKTMGVALTSCNVPHIGGPMFELGEDEIELGVGIHGEAGRSRQPFADAHTIVGELLTPIEAELHLQPAEPVALLVNGMGATSYAELCIVYKEAQERLQETGAEIVSAWVGNYVTSLDMQGCSITVARLDSEMQELLAQPVCTPALRKGL